MIMLMMKQRYVFSLIIALTLHMLIVGCNNGAKQKILQDTLYSFESSTIEFPDHFLKIEGTSYSFTQEDMSLPTLVYYHSSEKCTDCAINHLLEIKPMFQMADECHRFQVMIIFSPKPDNISYVIDKLSRRQFDFPVFVDIENSLVEAAIPDDPRFHTFLLYDQHPVMVGNPLSSEGLMDLFKKALLTTNH